VKIRPPGRRPGLSIVAAGALVVTVTVTLLFSIASFVWGGKDVVGWFGDVLMAGTLVLALIASIVALLAYGISNQRPKLTLSASLTHNRDEPFHAAATDVDEAGERRLQTLPGMISRDPPLELTVTVRNTARWSGKNVAVQLALVSMRGIRMPQTGWTALKYDYYDWERPEVKSVQWEGGADNQVHGGWTRELPPIDLTGVVVDPGAAPEIRLQVVAEGFLGDEIRIPLSIETYVGSAIGTGAVEGHIGYPSSGVPPLHMYLLPVPGPGEVVRVDSSWGQLGRMRWFAIRNVTPGIYVVAAYNPALPDLRGSFTESARSGPGNDHRPIQFRVTANGVVTGVAVTDWSASDLPPEPVAASKTLKATAVLTAPGTRRKRSERVSRPAGKES
jgi:hypothetical protein